MGILDYGLLVIHGYQGAGAGRLQRSPGVGVGGAGEAPTRVERRSLPKPWRISSFSIHVCRLKFTSCASRELLIYRAFIVLFIVFLH